MESTPQSTLIFHDVYKRAKKAAEYVIKIAGGSLKSAYDIHHAILTIPGLAKFVKSAQDDTANSLSKIVDAYRKGDVSDPESLLFL